MNALSVIFILYLFIISVRANEVSEPEEKTVVDVFEDVIADLYAQEEIYAEEVRQLNLQSILVDTLKNNLNELHQLNLLTNEVKMCIDTKFGGFYSQLKFLFAWYNKSTCPQYKHDVEELSKVTRILINDMLEINRQALSMYVTCANNGDSVDCYYAAVKRKLEMVMQVFQISQNTYNDYVKISEDFNVCLEATKELNDIFEYFFNDIYESCIDL